MKVTTILINDAEESAVFIYELCVNHGLTNHHVRALYPNTVYAKMVLTKQPTENFKFVVVDVERAFDKTSISKEIAVGFPRIQVIIIGENPKRKDFPENIHSVENLEMAARFIANHPDSRE